MGCPGPHGPEISTKVSGRGMSYLFKFLLLYPYIHLNQFLLAVLLSFLLISRIFLWLFIISRSRPDVKFCRGCCGPLGREEGSSQEKASLFYSLHSLDSFDIISNSFDTLLPDV